jgi:type IV pilus assembly protein PilA
MRKNKGFTLIELMVVILIVAILAAVLAPMLTGRINDAKWTEGKAGAGTLATALRAYFAEHEGWDNGGTTYPGGSGTGAFAEIGVTDVDLTGKYFTPGEYTVGSLGGDTTVGPIYTITVTAPAGLTGTYALDQTGTWAYTP